MWMRVAAFPGVEGGGRQTLFTHTLPKPLPQPGVLHRTFQKEAWRKLGKGGRQDAQSKWAEAREQTCAVSGQFWACTHSVPASQAYFHIPCYWILTRKADPIVTDAEVRMEEP